jgi:general stress protein 26
MNDDKHEAESLAKFRTLLGKFDDAMLVSTDGDGQPHARPMRIAARDHDRLDDLWFVTSINSGKIDEISGEPRVAVTMTDGDRYLALSGSARVVIDRGKVHELWKDSWRLWFPDGPGSEEIALIQVRPERGEYWDQSFPQGLRFALAAAKAWVTNEALERPDDPEQHAKVELG